MSNDNNDLKRRTTLLEKRVKALEEAVGNVPVYNDPKEEDRLLAESIALAKPLNAISASYLQRRLSIGYARAARILDQLEKLGVIKTGEGSEPRKVVK